MIAPFEFLGRTFNMYTLMALIGIFAAGIFASFVAKKRGIDYVNMITMLLIAAIGVAVGGHLLYGITNIDLLINFGEVKDIGHFFTKLVYIFGGAVFYGGLIGGSIAGLIYLKKKKLPVSDYTDIAGTAIPLFHVFGRVGCFLGGCCYGVESSFGFTYLYHPDQSVNGVNRFPVQLFEAGFNLLLFGFLVFLLFKNVLKGRIFSVYLIIYPIGRFILEFWRGDEIRGFIFGISTSQFISIFVFIIGIVMFILNSRKNSVPKAENGSKVC